MKPHELPDDVEEAWNVLNSYAPSSEEFWNLLRLYSKWKRDGKARSAPMLLEKLDYIFRGESVTVTWVWHVAGGEIAQSLPTVTGGAEARALNDHGLPKKLDVSRDVLLKFAKLSAEHRLSDLGISPELGPDGKISFGSMDGALAIQIVQLVDEIYRDFMPKKNLKNRDLDKAAVAWMNLGFYLAQLDSEMRQLLGDGRTSKERSIDALRVQLGRKKAGKITGDHQAAAAKSTRAQICALASAVRNDDPRITDEKLVEEVRARIKRKLTSATIHEHIRALKRSGQLPARSRN